MNAQNWDEAIDFISDAIERFEKACNEYTRLLNVNETSIEELAQNVAVMTIIAHELIKSYEILIESLCYLQLLIPTLDDDNDLMIVQDIYEKSIKICSMIQNTLIQVFE